MELPAFIPVFPLPNVVLFPDVPLPLHVFEPRYRHMVRDALAGPRLIGMALLRGDWQREYYGAPEIYRVGCAGKIVEAVQHADGTFNIVLAGIREFEVMSEQRERAYRQASVVWRPAPVRDVVPASLRQELVTTIERYLGNALDDSARELLRDTSVAGTTLVNAFAYWLDLSPVEKQCLLEASAELRGHRLRDILEFHVFAPRGGRAESCGQRMH